MSCVYRQNLRDGKSARKERRKYGALAGICRAPRRAFRVSKFLKKLGANSCGDSYYPMNHYIPLEENMRKKMFAWLIMLIFGVGYMAYAQSGREPTPLEPGRGPGPEKAKVNLR